MSNEKNEKTGRFHQFMRDRRVLMGISLLLAVVVWLVLAVINGDLQELTIEDVPVRADFSGTVAEELDLQPFWSGPRTDPNQLTVDVTVRCPRYENITADNLDAVLVTGNEYTAGEHSMAIRVTPKKALDRDRFTIVSFTPDSIPLYFDHYKESEFELTAELLGKVSVAEGYHAEEVLFSKKGVTVSGPAGLVEAIVEVKAQVTPEGTYHETAVFRNIPILPVDQNGATSPYLTVEGGAPEINATLPVWKRETLFPAVDFLNVPAAYLSAPLRTAVTPEVVHAALPEDRITEELRFAVGAISFQALSPANNRFVFHAADLKEIRLFDETEAFTAVVDMTGFETRRFTLQGANVWMGKPEGFEVQFGNVAEVTVVGPAAALESLTSADLRGVAQPPEDPKPGAAALPVSIHVDRENCWVYGEYTVRAVLTEE